MQETAVDTPEVVDAAQQDISAPEAAETPELAFSDAVSASRWVKSLPLSNVGQAYQALLDQLHVLTASEMGPRDRATIAELIREPVAHLHTELAKRYAGKPQPLDERESEAADQAIALWQALWIQYSVCLKPLLEGSTELQGVKAKLCSERSMSASSSSSSTGARAAFHQPTCGRSCTPTTGSPRCSTARWRVYPIT